jgi:hypothetical protein
MAWVEAVARAGWEWVIEMALRRFGYVERGMRWRVAGARYAFSER